MERMARYVVALLVVFAVLRLAQQWIGRHANRGYGDPTIFSFEFARTAQRVQEIFRRWSDDGQHSATLSLYVDFFSTASFSAFLVAATLGVLYAAGTSRPLGIIAAVAGVGAMAVGVFGVFENIALLRQLRHGAKDGLATFAYRLAVGKYMLVLLVGAFLLFAVIVV